jgi:hypothetical protein
MGKLYYGSASRATNHGIHNKIFTVSQGMVIVDEILGDSVFKSRLFKSATLLTIFHRRAEELGIDFGRAGFSTHFIHGFTKRHKQFSRPSSRLFHLRRQDRASLSSDQAYFGLNESDSLAFLRSTQSHYYLRRGSVSSCPEWALYVGADRVTMELTAHSKEIITIFGLPTRKIVDDGDAAVHDVSRDE